MLMKFWFESSVLQLKILTTLIRLCAGGPAEALWQVTFTFSGTVHNVLEAVFKMKVNFDFKIMYHGDLEEFSRAKWDKHLLRVLLVACKNALTRKWLKDIRSINPNQNEWIDLVYNLHYILWRESHLKN